MPDILASHEENNHLCDIGGMVPHSLEMLGNEYEFDGPRDRARIFEHVCEKFSKDLLIHVVDYVVVENDLLGKLGVRVHKSVETFLKNLLRRLSHDREI